MRAWQRSGSTAGPGVGRRLFEVALSCYKEAWARRSDTCSARPELKTAPQGRLLRTPDELGQTSVELFERKGGLRGGDLAAHVNVLRDRRLGMSQLVCDGTRRQPGLVQERGRGLTEDVTGDPINPHHARLSLRSAWVLEGSRSPPLAAGKMGSSMLGALRRAARARNIWTHHEGSANILMPAEVLVVGMSTRPWPLSRTTVPRTSTRPASRSTAAHVTAEASPPARQ